MISPTSSVFFYLLVHSHQHRNMLSTNAIYPILKQTYRQKSGSISLCLLFQFSIFTTKFLKIVDDAPWFHYISSRSLLNPIQSDLAYVERAPARAPVTSTWPSHAVVPASCDSAYQRWECALSPSFLKHILLSENSVVLP